MSLARNLGSLTGVESDRGAPLGVELVPLGVLAMAGVLAPALVAASLLLLFEPPQPPSAIASARTTLGPGRARMIGCKCQLLGRRQRVRHRLTGLSKRQPMAHA